MVWTGLAACNGPAPLFNRKRSTGWSRVFKRKMNKRFFDGWRKWMHKYYRDGNTVRASHFEEKSRAWKKYGAKKKTLNAQSGRKSRSRCLNGQRRRLKTRRWSTFEWRAPLNVLCSNGNLSRATATICVMCGQTEPKLIGFFSPPFHTRGVRSP